MWISVHVLAVQEADRSVVNNAQTTATVTATPTTTTATATAAAAAVAIAITSTVMFNYTLAMIMTTQSARLILPLDAARALYPQH